VVKMVKYFQNFVEVVRKTFFSKIDEVHQEIFILQGLEFEKHIGRTNSQGNKNRVGPHLS